MRSASVAAKGYNTSCVKRHAKVNSELYTALCRFRNVDDLNALDLSKNYVGNDAGFACLLELIKNAPQLRVLNLASCGLTTQNVTDLVGVLLAHPNIREVHLQCNRLYIDSGVQLVRLARFNPRVAYIYTVDQPATEIERQLANHIPPQLVAEMHRHLKFNRDAAGRQLAAGGTAAAGGGAATTTGAKRAAQRAAAEEDGEM